MARMLIGFAMIITMTSVTHAFVGAGPAKMINGFDIRVAKLKPTESLQRLPASQVGQSLACEKMQYTTQLCRIVEDFLSTADTNEDALAYQR